MSKKKYVKEETFQLRETIPIQLEDSTWKHNPYSLIIEKDFVRYESEHIKKPRISSHTLVDLSGINKFTSPGKTLLSVFGLLEKEDFDSYQAYKGGIVEVFAERYLKKEYPDAVVEA